MIPEALRGWLFSNHSLTTKLQQCDANAKVVVLSQKWFGRIFERNIIMMANNQPVWFAKTTIPYISYQARAIKFDQLGSDALGTLLFSDPQIVKLKRVIQSFPDSEFKQLLSPHGINSITKQKYYGRTSTYLIDRVFPIFVTEIFLSSMDNYLC